MTKKLTICAALLTATILSISSCNQKPPISQILQENQSEANESKKETTIIYNEHAKTNDITEINSYDQNNDTTVSTNGSQQDNNFFEKIKDKFWERINEDGSMTGISINESHILIYDVDSNCNVKKTISDIRLAYNEMTIINPKQDNQNFKYPNYHIEISDDYMSLYITDNEEHLTEYSRIFSNENSFAEQLQQDQKVKITEAYAATTTVTTTEETTVSTEPAETSPPRLELHDGIWRVVIDGTTTTTEATTAPPETIPTEVILADGRTLDEKQKDLYNANVIKKMSGMKWLANNDTKIIISDTNFIIMDKDETESSKKIYYIHCYKGKTEMYDTDTNEKVCDVILDTARQMELYLVYSQDNIIKYNRIPRDNTEKLHEYGNEEHP